LSIACFTGSLLFPLTRKALLDQKIQSAWTENRPNWGAGRIDPFNPVKFGMLHLPDDGTIGKSVWSLDAREAFRPNAPLHWNGQRFRGTPSPRNQWWICKET
jgi:hypothetical protein